MMHLKIDNINLTLNDSVTGEELVHVQGSYEVTVHDITKIGVLLAELVANLNQL